MDLYTKEFVEFWNCEFEGNYYIHPKDRAQLNDKCVGAPASIGSFDRNTFFSSTSKKQLHSSLVPIPYNGCLSRADVFLLTLNPGAKPLDYYAEYCDSSFKSRRFSNLRQVLDGVEFPLVGLDPKFLWASTYWSAKLREIAETTAQYSKRCYLDALREMANRMAIVQLVPYHSSTSRSVKKLASSEEARRFVRKGLLPRAKRGEIALVVLRGNKYWDITENQKKHPNIVVYRDAETRNAPLGAETRGGKAIIKWLQDRPEPKR